MPTPERSVLRADQHPTMRWTSFDRFGRYAAVVRALRSELSSGQTVLDVGDGSGHLSTFAPELVSVALDPVPSEDPLPDAVRVRGDGSRLPLADGAVDAVISCDVLEHVEPAHRSSFVTELTRVARSMVVVAAPFDTHGVAGVEDLVSRYARVISGRDQPQLAEHAQHGLPDVDDTAAVLAAAGWDVTVAGEGNLFDWLGAMLLRLGAETRDELRPLADGFDVFYNHLLSERGEVGPFYRHVLVARPSDQSHGQIRHAFHDEQHRSAGPSDAVSSAMLSQLSLLEVVPRLGQVQHAIDGVVPELDNRLEQAVVHLDDGLRSVLDQLGRIEIAQGQLSDRLDQLHDEVIGRLDRTFSARARAKLGSLRNTDQ